MIVTLNKKRGKRIPRVIWFICFLFLVSIGVLLLAAQLDQVRSNQYSKTIVVQGNQLEIISNTQGVKLVLPDGSIIEGYNTNSNQRDSISRVIVYRLQIEISHHPLLLLVLVRPNATYVEDPQIINCQTEATLCS